MNKFLLFHISFLSAVAFLNAQNGVFELENISVSDKTTHEISFTEDGRTLYFTRTIDNKWNKAQLGYQSYFADGKWSKPIGIEFVDSLYNMSISPDGKRVLFCKEDTTWMCIKENGKWSVPKKLNTTADLSFNGGYYHILNDFSFYFSGVQEDEQHPYDDIYYTILKDGQYQKPIRLNSNINTEATEFSPWVNKKNDLIIFTRYDRSSEENTGIFISRCVENTWQNAQKIEALKYGWGVFVREDIRTMYYTVNGLIHQYDLDLLEIRIE